MRILFVCLANICRSPLAEGVFRRMVDKAGLDGRIQVDSAGINDYHEGSGPDPRAKSVAFEHGIELTSSSRPVQEPDFEYFDIILAMDRENERALKRMCPRAYLGKIRKLRAFEDHGNPPDVPDPYYDGPYGFHRMFEIIEQNCRALLEEVGGKREGRRERGEHKK